MSAWTKEADRRWKKRAVWIQGDGPHALLAWCGQLSVTLWKTEGEAQKEKQTIDSVKCGGKCIGRHEIVNLQS